MAALEGAFHLCQSVSPLSSTPCFSKVTHEQMGPFNRLSSIQVADAPMPTDSTKIDPDS